MSCSRILEIIYFMRNFLSAADISKEEMMVMFEDCRKLEKFSIGREKSKLLEGKVLATLFFEPSTRTRLSFETAMLRLGGGVINVVGAEASSLSKGESFEDMGRVISKYADIVVMRSSEIGSVSRLAKYSEIPVVSAGEGIGEHPTQALLDMYTIWKEKDGIDGLKIVLMGDLKFGRTVHSLVKMLANFKVELVFCSVDFLKMPEEIKSYLREKYLFVTP